MQLINVGYDNYIASDRILAVIKPDSAPIRRMIQDNKELGRVVDATFGRGTKTLIVMDNGYLVLSALSPESISKLAGTEVNNND
ncbi:MAG: DUF370 domain-containing protein [Clostridia bacterium]|nr:DUF370 domain-containing protein [Clostridia bacterium]